MAATAFDVAAVRSRFSALAKPLALFDGPGGTQVPDSVIEAMARYLRESNANVSGPYEPSRRTEELVARAREAAGRFLGADPETTIFGPNMTTLNFALSRTVARELEAGDEIVVTRLDHDANVAPWLELAHDMGVVVRFADIRADTTLDLDDLAAQLSERTRIVAFPLASNAVGTTTDAGRIVELAHSAGALAWVDAVHYAAHAPVDFDGLGADVLLCAPYKFYAPHCGIAVARRELLERWRPYKVRPASSEPIGHKFETGTMSHENLAGFVAAVEYLEELGWPAIMGYERELGERFLAGLPENCTLHGVPSMDGRVSTFAFNVAGLTAREVASRLGEQGFAVWQGNYYAVEVMKRLELPHGAVRAGIVHYNTAREVDALLEAVSRL